MTGYAAVVLGAGLGSRFRAAGGEQPSKLVAQTDQGPVVRRVAHAALRSKARPVLIVTGHARAAVEHALSGLDVDFVHNPDFASGMASSVRMGVGAVPNEIAGAVMLLGDMPLVTTAMVNDLVDAAAAAPNADALVPTFKGQWGNPVVLCRSLFSRAMMLTADAGARRLLTSEGVRIVEVPIHDKGVLLDIDLPNDLEDLSH